MKKVKVNFLKTTSGTKKLVFCLSLAFIFCLLLTTLGLELKSLIILGWDTFSIAMITLNWTLFFTTSSKELCEVVEKQDDGLKVIFSIVVVAVCFSLLGTLILLLETDEKMVNKILHTVISLSPIVLSWILLHTIFAIRYAHLYHDHDSLKTGTKVGGLEFPTKTDPDYVDFAYFSFVIGMTFQVSDIAISSRVIRRFVLMHSLISFVFNTIIVALTINTIAGLRG